MTPWLLRHDLLEDERRWALLAAGVATVAAGIISSYDVDLEAAPALFLVAVVGFTGYLIRSLGGPFPAWLVPISAAATHAAAALIDNDAEGHAFFALIALFYAFFREHKRRRLWWSVVFTAPMPFVLFATGMIDSDGWLYWAMGCLICAGFGEVAYGLRLAVAEVENQRRRATEQAVVDERRKIARDVHDLVGHSLTVTLLHLTAARRTATENPAEAAAALARAEQVGRDAMAEIRGTVKMLADAESIGETGPGAPVPGLTDLEPLVEQYRRAGLQIELLIDTDLAGVEPARSLAGYRIIQEALVNVTKHASGSAVRVETIDEAGDLLISIVDRGGSAATRRVQPDDEPGHGLIGMGERARSVGGTLLAGPTEDGWRVEALLPRVGVTEAAGA